MNELTYQRHSSSHILRSLSYHIILSYLIYFPGPDNIGTEFYVAFLENFAIPQENDLELYITSATHYPATFQISSPLMPGLFEVCMKSNHDNKLLTHKKLLYTVKEF